MRMHQAAILAAASFGMMGTAIGTQAPSHKQEAVAAPTEVKVVPTKRQQQRWAGTLPDYRAKGPQAKQRKRSNRLHVSKRVRRAHRRAKQGKR